MKRNVISTIILAVAVLLAVGCNRENVAPAPQPEPQPEPQDSTVYHIRYLDDKPDTTIIGYSQLINLIDSFCDIALSGNGVIFWNSDIDFFGPNPLNRKDNIATSDRDSLIGWCAQMFTNNYASALWYENYPNQEFKAQSVSLPIFPVQVDLAEFLPGCWVFTKTYIEYWNEASPFVEYRQNGTYQYSDTLVFTDTTVYSNVLSTFRPYEIIGGMELLFPFPGGDCGDISKIIQIGQDTLLIMNCAIKGQINYLAEDRCTYRYMFARVNSR